MRGSVTNRGGAARRFGRLRLFARVGAIVTLAAMVTGGAWFWQQRQSAEARKFAGEKAQLAVDNARIAGEKREQLVRLNIANGGRLLDEGLSANALVWFANALPLVSNPAEANIHRVRIQQVLDCMPKLLRIAARFRKWLDRRYCSNERRHK